MPSTDSGKNLIRKLLVGFMVLSALSPTFAQNAEPPAMKEPATPAVQPAEKKTETQVKPTEDAKSNDEKIKPENTMPALVPDLSEEERAKQELEAEEARKAAAEAEAKKAAAAAEAARIAEEKRVEAERTWFDKLLLNSKLYTGLNAGMVIPLNSLHSAGYGFGMTIDYLAYQRYGFHFGAETGLLPAKSGALQASATTIRISDQGTMGYLNLRFAGLYAFPKFLDIETAAGAGISVYRLNSGTYSFDTTIAPVVLGTAYYNLFASLQLGVIAQVVLPSVSKLSSPGSEFTLDSSQSLANASLHASVRYVWF